MPAPLIPTCSLVLLASLLAGCGTSFFAEPKTNPVIEDTVGRTLFGGGGAKPLATLATTAERRVVWATLKRRGWPARLIASVPTGSSATTRPANSATTPPG